MGFYLLLLLFGVLCLVGLCGFPALLLHLVRRWRRAAGATPVAWGVRAVIVLVLLVGFGLAVAAVVYLGVRNGVSISWF